MSRSEHDGYICSACLAGDCADDPDVCTDQKHCTCCGNG